MKLRLVQLRGWRRRCLSLQTAPPERSQPCAARTQQFATLARINPPCAFCVMFNRTNSGPRCHRCWSRIRTKNVTTWTPAGTPAHRACAAEQPLGGGSVFASARSQIGRHLVEQGLTFHRVPLVASCISMKILPTVPDGRWRWSPKDSPGRRLVAECKPSGPPARSSQTLG